MIFMTPYLAFSIIEAIFMNICFKWEKWLIYYDWAWKLKNRQIFKPRKLNFKICKFSWMFLFQRFFMCHENGRSGRFTCPVGTLFSDTLGRDKMGFFRMGVRLISNCHQLATFEHFFFYKVVPKQTGYFYYPWMLVANLCYSAPLNSTTNATISSLNLNFYKKIQYHHLPPS